MKRIILVGLVLLLLLGGWGVSWLFTDKRAPFFKPIEHYELANEFTYLQPEEVHQVLDRYLGHSFWSVNLEAIQAELTHLDWVNQVEIKRRWPNQIYVKIEEQSPVARWGDTGLINQLGEVFYPKEHKAFEELVRLEGASLDSAKILTTLGKFQQKLSSLGFTVVSLKHQVDGVWQLGLLSGSKIILDAEAEIRALERFVLAYPQLAEPLIKSPQVYDLRYSNGFIVGKIP